MKQDRPIREMVNSDENCHLSCMRIFTDLLKLVNFGIRRKTGPKFCPLRAWVTFRMSFVVRAVEQWQLAAPAFRRPTRPGKGCQKIYETGRAFRKILMLFIAIGP